jgi:hypothetical protein
MDVQPDCGWGDDGTVAGDDPVLLQALDAGAGCWLGQPDSASDLGSGESAVGLEQFQDGTVDLIE